MINRFRPLTPSDVLFRTSMARSRADELQQAVDDYVNDARRDRRMEVGECASCHYLSGGRIGGCAMTTWFCGICGKEDMAGSTNTPRVCRACGKEHSICTHCGGDLKMSTRRRKWPTPVSEPASGAADDHAD